MRLAGRLFGGLLVCALAALGTWAQWNGTENYLVIFLIYCMIILPLVIYTEMRK